MKIEVTIPDGKSGDWSVETFQVGGDEMKLYNLRAMFHPGCRTIEAGIYKKLCYRGSIIMSNTPSEVSDHLSFIHRAQGKVLMNGLGLGVALKAILDKTEVESVTVIEKEQDVINLVGKYFMDNPKVQIIHADAFTWKPSKGVIYDVVWHDIWTDICSDNLPQMYKLHRKYGRRSKWQGSWCRELCER